MAALLFSLTAGLLFASTAAAEPPVVIVVPSGPGGAPQPSYNGTPTVFKAIARGACSSSLTSWRWTWGDGEVTVTPAGDPSDPTSRTSTAAHRYELLLRDGETRDGSVTALWDDGTESSDDFRAVQKGVSKDVNIERAVLDGLWFLHQNQIRYEEGAEEFGYWGSLGSEIAPTARAILALEVQGHLPGADPDTYAYSYAVERGLNHLLSRLVPIPIESQEAGDPDSNGNGVGLTCLGGEEMIDQPLILTALAGSMSPDATAAVGGAFLMGRTYRDIATDMVDYIAWAQNEDPDPTDPVPGGGWGSGANLLPNRNSVSGYPILALMAAEENLGIAAPGWVRTELEPWLTCSQNTEPGAFLGGFGDTGPDDYPNVDKTGGTGLVGHAYLGTPLLDPRVTSAIAFIDAHWDDPGENLGNYYAIYSTQKGARSIKPELAYMGSHDWFEQYSDYLIANQETDGGWPATPDTDRLGSSTFSVLTLTPSVFEPRPVAVADAGSAEIVCGEAVTFDASRSVSTDPTKGIIKYEWDFDGDGAFDFQTTDPSEEPTHAYSPDPSECPKRYLARLRVTQDGDRARADYDTVEVIVSEPPEPIPAILDISFTGTQPDGTVIVGDPLELKVQFTTQEDETYTATVDWGDGSPAEEMTITQNSTATATGTHKFAQVKGFKVEIDVVGSRGGMDHDSAWMTVSGGELMIEQCPTVVGTEGFKTEKTATFKDTATRPHSATVDPGDGTGPQPATVTERQTNSMEGTVTAEHTYSDDAVYETITRVLADDGTEASTVTAAIIANAPPVITHFDPGSDPFEGQVASVSGTYTDPGAGDTHAVRIDWDDGTPDSFFDVSMGSWEATHTFAEDGTYSVTTTLIDDDGGWDTVAAPVTVQIAPKILDITLTGPEPDGTIYEGDEVELLATMEYPDYMVPTAEIDWGDGSPPEPATITHNSTATARATHRFADNRTGTAEIKVMFNPEGIVIKKSVEWKTENRAPKITSGPSVEPSPSAEGTRTSLLMFFSDAGKDDTHTATVDWGDGASSEPATVTSQKTEAGVAGTVTATHTYADDGDYAVTVTVTDDDGGFDTETTLVTVQPTNTPPVANAGPDQTVHAGVPVTLDGSGSSDAEGDELSYAWSITSKPAGSAAALSDPTAVSPSMTTDVPGDYVVELVVNDGQADSDPDSVTISTANSAPVAEAGPDQAVTLLGSTVQLAGDQSYDPDGDALIYQWTFIYKPIASSAVLSDPSTANPTFEADVHGDYALQLVVSDGWSHSEPDTISVSFENVKPVADAGSSQSVVVGEEVTLDGSGSSDANGDSLTYMWSLTTVPEGSSASLANPKTVSTTFVPDLPGTYVAQLIVDDGYEASDPATVEIEVVSLPTAAIESAQLLQAQIALLDPGVFKNTSMQHALTNKINAVIAKIEAGDYEDALDKLEHDILRKTDGVATTGAPDKNDWIRDAETQQIVYPYVMALILNVQLLLGG